MSLAFGQNKKDTYLAEFGLRFNTERWVLVGLSTTPSILFRLMTILKTWECFYILCYTLLGEKTGIWVSKVFEF